MDETCHMKYIDHFYQLVIKSILTYLTDGAGSTRRNIRVVTVVDTMTPNLRDMKIQGV